ncbi:MAG: TIGR03089 family protein [Arthrobacter sp.]|uniref:TIGR03089 family protein n=1 Tax=Arthrobacter sp. TaxID=1667 RepID=UPI003477EA77
MDAENQPRTFADDLLARVRDSTAPLLVWYGTAGERVELSGHVFDNWVAKSANLLTEELDAGPGTVVALRLPAHWKSLALAFGALHTGAELVLEPAGTAPGARVDVVASDDPLAAAAGHPGAEVVAVALGAMALAFPGPAPAGALDYAAEVRAFGDYYLAEPVDGGAPALRDARGAVDYAALFSPAAGDASGNALLGPGASLGRALREALTVWGGGDALVLLGDGVQATDRLRASERVARVLGP